MRFAERDKYGVSRATGERVAQHLAPLFEQREPLAFRVAFRVALVGEIVGRPREGVDRVKIFSERFWDENRPDGEVLVMRAGEPLAIRISVINRPRAVSDVFA